MEADAEAQQLELEALEAIYGEDLVVLDEDPLLLELAVPLDLGAPRQLRAAFAAEALSSDREAYPGDALADAPDELEAAELSSTAKLSVPISDTVEVSGVPPRTKMSLDGRMSKVPIAIQFAENLLASRAQAPEMERCLSGEGNDEMVVTHVPPLRLRVTFCRGYPSVRSPEFTISAQWLSKVQLAKLCAELDALGAEQDGAPVVYTWADWLHANALSHLALDSAAPLLLEANGACLKRTRSGTLADHRGICECQDPLEALHELLEYNRDHSWWIWQQSAHTCEICFSEKPGTAFTRFGTCPHIFCTECTTSMLRVHIAEGTVTSIRCPYCKEDMAPHVLRQLVDEDTYNRWHRFQVRKILNDQPLLVYCPRCEDNGRETPILPETDSRISMCDVCEFVFCPDCRAAYHPADQACEAQLERLQRLKIERDNTIAKGDKKRRLAEELASLQAILKDTVPCPSCKMPITRAQGCNHMTCTYCSTHFCYRCGMDISKTLYDHFRADKCPTFDRSEVDRLRHAAFGEEGAQALEAELEMLRQQYPEQAHMVWNFRPPVGAWRNRARRRVGDVPCPTCRQWNGRAGTNNHVKCRACGTNFCFSCRKKIYGVVTAHFRGPSACPNHSVD